MNAVAVRKNFKGQLENEYVICYFRKHWITLLHRLAAIPVLVFLTILGFFFLEPLSQSGLLVGVLTLMGFCLLLYGIHRQFLVIFHFYLHTYILTNYRIVEVNRSVFMHDTKKSIDLSTIQDIQKKQYGLVQSILNYGSLTIVLSGTSENVVMTFVPRPEYQFKKINQVKSSYLPARMTPVMTMPRAGRPDVEWDKESKFTIDKSLSYAE